MRTEIQEKLGRICGGALFLSMLIRQFIHLGNMSFSWMSVTRWFLITFLFFLFFWAYVRRVPAKSLARRPVEILLPILCGAMPFIVFLGAYYGQKWAEAWGNEMVIEAVRATTALWVSSPSQSVAGLGVMAIGEVITVIGMFFLGSSFSILSEARTLVVSGMYKRVRHPLYMGEIITVLGYVVSHVSYWTTFSSLVFIGLQAYRAKIEEAKLESVFPEYADYREQTGFFFPRL